MADEAGLGSSLLAPGPPGWAQGWATPPQSLRRRLCGPEPALCWARGPWRRVDHRLPSLPGSVTLHPRALPCVACVGGWRGVGRPSSAVSAVAGSLRCIKTAPFSSQCPFHGKIIPRDDAGRPLHAEDRAREQRQQLQRPAGRPGGSGGRGRAWGKEALCPVASRPARGTCGGQLPPPGQW